MNLKRLAAKLAKTMGTADLKDIDERLARLPTRLNEFGYDPFGLKPTGLKPSLVTISWIYRNYFRVELNGVGNIPEGRVLLISNHSGQLPIDGVMIGTGIFLEGEPPRMVRSMVERFVPNLPWVSTYFSRMGQMLGTPDNCIRMLENDEAVLVFPEGARGINKMIWQRYQLQQFGLGFMRLALATNTPIVPIGVVGAEEQAPAVYNLKKVARLIGAPNLPITVTMPLLGPLGMLPMPTKYHIHFGEPIQFEGDPNDEDAVIERKVREVRSAIRSLLTYGLKHRRSIFW
jgi:1-acyl-sn-glycerol-3-phosphate acyltransferase